MKSLLLAMLVGLMMVGCGEEAPKETVQDEAVQYETTPPLGENLTVPDLNLTMIWVKPGTFMMGFPEKAGRSRNETQHQVTLTKGFYLGKYEVTQAQWEQVNRWGKNWRGNPSGFEGADHPVERVSWNDAVEFCKILTEMEKKAGRVPEGIAYQLPTEAQWEYACRAGTTTAYSWGDSISLSNANYDFDVDETAPAGKYPANPWGFHDMHGNVCEWCADFYDTYPSRSVIDPEGTASNRARAYRGGGWWNDGKNLRSAMRFAKDPRYRNLGLGFRVSLRASK